MSDYAVIIPAYNEEAFLPGTLKVAREAMGSLGDAFGRGELIVVDNASADRTAEFAREGGADRVVFEEHHQIARARNTGAAATDARWIIFLDADTLLTPTLLRDALSALASGRIVGGGARLMMDREVSLIVAAIVRFWDAVSRFRRLAAGSFFFVRHDAFDAVGGFDEAIYAGEEVWLARRLKAWAKREKMEFVVLLERIVTSSRKSDWFSPWAIFGQLMLFTFCPWATRHRRLCRLWYRRPSAT